MLSSSQFDSGQAQQGNATSPPLSLGKNTAGSTAASTSWNTRGLGGGRPLSYSSKTRGTTFNWDDASGPTLPASDKGAGRNE